MTTADLIEAVFQRLENRAAYTATEIVRSGLNPALTLFALVHAAASIGRVVVTLPAESSFLDLRDVFPQVARLTAITRGQVRTDRPRASLAPMVPLLPMEGATLGRIYPRWIMRRGIPQRWWMMGLSLVGITPRPVADCVLTLTGRMRASSLAVDDPHRPPEIDVGWHPVLAEIAAQLVLVKQGAGEAERALQHLQGLVQQGTLRGALPGTARRGSVA